MEETTPPELPLTMPTLTPSPGSLSEKAQAHLTERKAGKTGLPPGAKDLTASLGHILPNAQPGHVAGTPPPVSSPLVNLNVFATVEAMKGAVNNTYLGDFTENDAKGNVSRTVQVTGWQDIMMNEIVQDDRFGYKGSKARLMRHAIELLITYYQEKGMIAEERQGLFGDLLRAGRMLREDAERERIRTGFTEHIRAHDRAMDTARMTGDWALIARKLQDYMDSIESCENESQRKILRAVFAESVATRTAVMSFNRWLHDPDRVPDAHVEGWSDGWPELGRQWNDWYNDWGSV